MLSQAVVLMPDTRPLTPRERQLVKAVAEGCTNKEIAARLGLSVQTVKNQLSSLYAKLGVSTRLGLAVYIMKHRGTLE
jgi:DNA-binding NarL/FixJ family response regulator